MDQFGILITSTGPDLPYTRRLLASIGEFCKDDIPVAVVVPDKDLALFAPVVAGLAELLPESLWGDQLVDGHAHGSSLGYINQDIIKMSFWQQGLFANYLCADPETVFIRPFSTADFMYSEDVPYTFVTEDAELRADPIYESAYGLVRDGYLVGLREFLELPPLPYKTTNALAVLSSMVCENLSNHLSSMDWTWVDAFELCPYVFSWYNFWLEREQIIPRMEREPTFKTICHEYQYLELALKGIRENDLARGYVGVVVNSELSRQFGHVGFDEPLDQTLGRYVSQRDLAHGAIERILRRLPRVRRIMHL